MKPMNNFNSVSVLEDSTSNGPTPKSRGAAPLRPRPPPVAPKPRGSSIAQPPVAAPRQSTNPPARPSGMCTALLLP